MIIKELEIISFGKFSNKTIQFSQGLNIIYGENESGKSTVIDFIYSMFYGLGDNRGKGLSMREKYTPWSGGVCEGKITVLTDNNEQISIYRKCGVAKKYDILRVYNNETGENLSISPEELIGVNGETFLKTLCIKQLSTVFHGNNDEITGKLSNIVSSGDENTDYEKAQKILEGIRREIRPQRGNGGTLNEVLNKISLQEKAKDTQQKISAELRMLKGHIESAEKKVKAIEERYSELKNSTPDFSMESFMQELKNESGRKSFLSPFSVLSMLMFVLSLILFFAEKKIFFFTLFLSVLLLISGIIKKKKSNTEIYDEIINMHSQASEYDKKLLLLKEELFAEKTKLEQLKSTEKALRSSINNNDAFSEDLYKKKLVLKKKLKTVTLASEALKNAHTNMQKNFTPSLNKKASEYLSYISDGKYARIYCDEEFKVQIDCDIPRESSYFSGGTVDQLYLVIRLALADMLFENSSYTMILDQPFLQYDDNRKKRTVELLETQEKKRQILLFTCDTTLKNLNKATQILT